MPVGNPESNVKSLQSEYAGLMENSKEKCSVSNKG